jgi:hypothetical protein
LKIFLELLSKTRIQEKNLIFFSLDIFVESMIDGCKIFCFKIIESDESPKIINAFFEQKMQSSKVAT